MSLAVKHFDMVMGVDTHICLVPTPAGPVPTPLPNPFVGIMFDPMDYVPKLGATVFINGLPRGKAGSAAKALPPHIPMAGPFAKPPGNDGQLFMGSATVVVEGDPMGYGGLPVLTCQDVGMPPPPRPSKKSEPPGMYLPTSLVTPIPSGPPVMVGGPPTISMNVVMGKLQDELFGRLGEALAKTKLGLGFNKLMKGVSNKLHGLAGKVLDKLGVAEESEARNLVSRAICTVTGHPVDVATGKVFTEFVDLVLPGPMPFALERVWFSTSTYRGPLGHGWHASFDLALAVDQQLIGVRLGDGRVIRFPAIRDGERYLELGERLELERIGTRYRMRALASGWVYTFENLGVHEGRLTSIEDRHGHTITFFYDAQGRPRRIVDSSGHPWDLRYEQRSEHLRAIEGPHPTLPAERVVHLAFEYDPLGNLMVARDALGQAQRFRYERHLLVQETNKRGLSFYFEYDAKDDGARCIRTWGDGGIYNHALSYDLGRKITTVTNSLGHKTQYEHDGALVRRTVDAFGNVRSTEYDDAHRVVAERDELGQQRTRRYDERGNLIEIVEPSGANTKLEYDERDLPVRAVDAKGGRWRWERNERGLVVAQHDPLGNVTTFAYRGGLLVSVLDATGGTTSLGYDARGQLDALALPSNALTRYERDLLGRIVGVRDADGRQLVQRELDLLGRATRIEQSDRGVRLLSYDEEGNVLHMRDAGRDVRFEYQGMNRLALRSEAGKTVRFFYDQEEQLTSVVNESGAVYKFVLGPTGKVEEEHGFDGLVRRYERDRAGRVVRVTRPAGRHSVYTYDAASRITQVEHSDGTLERYAYDELGALLSATNEHATLELVRDPLGQVIRETQGDHWVESNYDACGRRVAVSSSLGARQTIDRSALGHAVRVREEQTGFEAHFTRDQWGRELERALPGGLSSRWRRNADGLPTDHVVESASGTLRAVGYKWDLHARVRRIIDGLHGTNDFLHDELGHLASAVYHDHSRELRLPDSVGNLFRSDQRGDRQYGAAGQLLRSWSPAGETRYEYDREGNLIQKVEPGGSTWQYAWNAAGMLAEVRRPTGDVVSFQYDLLGRRVAKTFRGQTTRWVWDADVPLHEWVEGQLTVPDAREGVHERDAALNRMLAQEPRARGDAKHPITWIFDPESFSPMAKLIGSQVHSIVCDHLGSPVVMADEQGQALWSASLSIYGELRDLEGERWSCPFRWPGQYEDLETGLYYNRYRYYDAQAGQYCSQDPIGLAGGPRAYAYVPDTLSWVDPLGLTGCDAQKELAAVGALNGKSRADIENDLAAKGFSQVPAHSGGSVWTKGMPDGSTAAVRLDPATVRTPAKGWADEVPHAHKETVLTSDVSGGNYGAKKATKLDDAALPAASPAAAHIPILW